METRGLEEPELPEGPACPSAYVFSGVCNKALAPPVFLAPPPFHVESPHDAFSAARIVNDPGTIWYRDLNVNLARVTAGVTL